MATEALDFKQHARKTMLLCMVHLLNDKGEQDYEFIMNSVRSLSMILIMMYQSLAYNHYLPNIVCRVC